MTTSGMHRRPFEDRHLVLFLLRMEKLYPLLFKNIFLLHLCQELMLSFV